MSIGGTYSTETAMDTMQCYNPQTNQWTMCAPMHVERVSRSAVAVNGKIYVVGGQKANR